MRYVYSIILILFLASVVQDKRRMKKFIHIFLIWLLLFGNAFATDYYIDPSASPGGNGLSDATAWDELSDFTPSAGNSYRFKCGGSFDYNGSSAWTISNDGNATSPIFIGAYYVSGSEVHEDDSPSMDQTCGNSASKPIFHGNSNAASTTTINVTGDYVIVDSIQIEGSEKALRVAGANSEIRYSWIGGDTGTSTPGGFGIRYVSGSDNGEIHHCVIDSQTDVFTEWLVTDGINLSSSSYNIVHHNIIDSWDHSGVVIEYGDYNEVYRNWFTNDEDMGAGPFSTIYTADNNEFYENYIEHQGDYSQIAGGSDNWVYHNIFNGVCQRSESSNCDYIDSAPLQPMFNLQGASNASVQSARVIGNTFYVDGGVGDVYASCLQMYSDGSDGPFDDNWFVNNVCYVDNNATDTDILMFIEDNDDPNWGAVTPQNISNNQFYWTNGTYKIWYYSAPSITVSGLNSATTDTTANNQEGNPLFNNAGSGDFSPGSGSPLINNGYDAGDDFKNVLNPSYQPPPTTNTVSTMDADVYGWPIGAYGRSGIVLSGLAPTAQQECGSDPQSVTMQATSDVNAYCRYSDDPADNTYVLMAGNQWSTGEGTTSHSTSVSQACDGLTLYYVICNTASDGSGDSSSRYEITVDVAASGSATVPPLSIEGNGNILLEYNNGGVVIQPQ